MKKEISAKGVKGFLLYNPFDKCHFFRVYDLVDKEKFTDFEITAEDIEIELLTDYNSLYTSEERNTLDYSSKVLGKSL